MKKTYPKYKPTEIPWMPEMPEHWEVRKAKHIFKERSEKGFPDEQLLAATQTKGVVRKEDYETRTVTAQKDFHLLKLVKEEDFVISLRSFQGGIEIAYHRGIISPAYTVFFEQKNVNLNKNYYKYLFKSHPFINSLTLFVTGIREGQNIDYSEFKDSLLPLPDENEQTAIANYLDTKTEQINRFIEKKEKLIALLKEQKNSILNNLVTQGLNPLAKKKQTNLIWLKDIPDNWTLCKLKHVSKVQSGLALNEGVRIVDGVFRPYLRVANVQDGYIDLSEVKTVQINPNSARKVQLQKYDLLMNEGGDFDKLGRGVVWEEPIINCLHQNHVFAVRAKKNIDPYWINILTQTYYGRAYFISKAKRTTNLASISSTNIKEFPVLLPPVEEIKAIKDEISKELSKIDNAITRIENEIEKVKELKQGLIAEVVTGKIKVA